VPSEAFDELNTAYNAGGRCFLGPFAQILAVCAQLERRPDCLHLVVIWPGSNISATLNGWNNKPCGFDS